MCQEWFTLGGVLLGGLISSGTSYGLYLLQTKREKEKDTGQYIDKSQHRIRVF